MKTIILFGYFNSNNVGDRIIAQIYKQHFSKEFEVICCSNEGNFHITDSYVNERLSIYERIKHKVYEFINVNYRSPRYKIFLKEYKDILSETSAVVFGGGNLLMDYSTKSKSYKKISEYINIANMYGKPCYAFAIGIGPFKTFDQLKNTIQALNRCKYVSFRDEYSYRLFIENGGKRDIAHKSIDPVFTLSINNSQDRNIIAINVINPSWNGTVYQYKILDNYIKLILEIAKRYSEKIIVIYATELNDVEGINYIKPYITKCSNVVIKNTLSYESLKELYMKTQIVIGARMHSLIIAYCYHIPVIGLVWSEKIRNFFDIIDKPECCINIDELGELSENIVCMTYEMDLNWEFDHVLDKAKRMLQRELEEMK